MVLSSCAPSIAQPVQLHTDIDIVGPTLISVKKLRRLEWGCNSVHRMYTRMHNIGARSRGRSTRRAHGGQYWL